MLMFTLYNLSSLLYTHYTFEGVSLLHIVETLELILAVQNLDDGLIPLRRTEGSPCFLSKQKGSSTGIVES